MKKEIVVLANNSSIDDIFRNIKENSLLIFTETNIETMGIIICAFFTIIGAGSYMFYKIKGFILKLIFSTNKTILLYI
jgi:hypothetical protein